MNVALVFFNILVLGLRVYEIAVTAIFDFLMDSNSQVLIQSQ